MNNIESHSNSGANTNRGGRRSKSKRRQINGIVLLDKPFGLSSNAALQEVKWLYAANKAGHTGSLDPLATVWLVSITSS